MLQYTLFTNKASECEGYLICMHTGTLYISLLATIAIDDLRSRSETNGKERGDARTRRRRGREEGGSYARRRRNDSYMSCGYRGKGPGSGEPGAYSCCCPCSLDPGSPTNPSGSSPDRKYRSISDRSNSEGGTGEGGDVRGGYSSGSGLGWGWGCGFPPMRYMRLRLALTGWRSGGARTPDALSVRGGPLRTAKCSNERV